MYNRSNESGRTMLETIMYLGLLIVIGASAAQHMHQAFRRYKIGRTAQQVIDFKKAVIQFTAADEDYTNLSVINMDAEHSVPLDMRATKNTNMARHALGGSVTTGPVGTEGNDRYLFYITFNNLFQGGCVEILTQGQFYGNGSELDTLIINNKHAWRYPYSFYNTTSIDNVHILAPASANAPVASIHLNITEALEACSQKKDNTITWIFS